jgi:hypothetical protein
MNDNIEDIDNLVLFNLENIMNKYYKTELQAGKSLSENITLFLQSARKNYKTQLLTLMENYLPSLHRKSTKKLFAVIFYFLFIDITFISSSFSVALAHEYERIFEQLYKASTSENTKTKVIFHQMPIISTVNLSNGEQTIYYDFISDYMSLKSANEKLKDENSELKSKVSIIEEEKERAVEDICRSFEKRYAQLGEQISDLKKELDSMKLFEKSNVKFINSNIDELYRLMEGRVCFDKCLIDKLNEIDSNLCILNEREIEDGKLIRSFFVQVVTKELQQIINPKLCVDYLDFIKKDKNNLTSLEIIFNSVLKNTKETIGKYNCYSIGNYFEILKSDYLNNQEEYIQEIKNFENYIYREIIANKN